MMNQKELDKYREVLLEHKLKILNGGTIQAGEDLKISSDDLPDEADIASNVINQEVSLSIRNREMAKLRQIEDALHRIEHGFYGQCEECDEPIGKKRLEHQPFTTLCITHAEERERQTMHQRVQFS